MPETTPTLSEYDFMELIAFERKANFEGFDYTYENYPPEFEATDMRELAEDESGFYAFYESQWDAINAWWDAHPADGVDLHNAHLKEAERREKEGRGASV